jgi:hypothetical protein
VISLNNLLDVPSELEGAEPIGRTQAGTLATAPVSSLPSRASVLARVANKPDNMQNSMAGVVSVDDQLGALLRELEAHGSLVRPLIARKTPSWPRRWANFSLL